MEDILNIRPLFADRIDAVERTSKLTMELIDSILHLRDTTAEAIRRVSSKMPVADLTELLFTHPYVKIGTLMDRGPRSRSICVRSVIRERMFCANTGRPEKCISSITG